MTGRRARRGGCEGGGADGSEEWRGIGRQTRVRGGSEEPPEGEATGAEFLRTKFVLLFILFSSRDY
jgi:hypothetical protein